MDTLQLEAQTRDVSIKAESLRRQRLIPAVFYGKGLKGTPLKVDYGAFRKIFLKAGSNKLIDLDIDGKKKVKVLVHDVQYYPLTGAINHVDFINVKLSEEVTTHVPVVVEGVAPAVKDLQGILTVVKDEIEVKCLPTALPESVKVDVSELVDFSKSIHVGDLKFPADVKVLDNPKDVVVTVSAPRKEEEVAPTPETGIEGTAAEAAAKEDEAKAAEAAATEGGGEAPAEKKEKE
jgi:large subunit ribosomal protein L25